MSRSCQATAAAVRRHRLIQEKTMPMATRIPAHDVDAERLAAILCAVILGTIGVLLVHHPAGRWCRAT